MICPGLVADDLSGFWKVSKPGDRDATRGTDGEVYRRAGALSSGEIELRGGGRAAGGQRATLPASSRPLRGGRGGRFDRSSPRSGFWAAGAGGPDRVCHRAVPDTLLGLYGEALPRGAASRARVSSRLYLDQGGIAEPRSGARGAQALGASQEETAAATAGDDAVSGRFAARVAGGSAGARLDCHLGRRHQRDLLGVSGRGGRDGFELHGIARGDRGQGAVLLALYRSGQSLLPDAQGRRQGRPGAPDPGRPRPGGAEDRAHPVLQPGSTRSHGAGVRHEYPDGALAIFHGPRRPSSAERRLVTVLSAEIVGFPAPASEADPEVLLEGMAALCRNCVEVIRRYDGFVANISATPRRMKTMLSELCEPV